MEHPSTVGNRYVKSMERERLTVTRHAQVNRKAVVFVHGVVGDAEQTWRNLPSMMFDDDELSFFDTAVYDYPGRIPGVLWPLSGMRRSSLDELGSDLARSFLTDLMAGMQYEQISIIGHGVGTLISMAAVRDMVRVTGHIGAWRIHSMAFLGEPYPRQGHLWNVLSARCQAVLEKPQETWPLLNFWSSSISYNKGGFGRFWLPHGWFVTKGMKDRIESSALISPGETNIIEVQDEDSLNLEGKIDQAFQAIKAFLLRCESLQDERFSWLTGRVKWASRAFWDRAPDFDRLAELIADEGVLVIQVVGPPGVGKTSLVREVTSELDPSTFSVVHSSLSDLKQMQVLFRRARLIETGRPKMVLIIDDADAAVEDGSMMARLKELVALRAFDKFILVSRKTLPLEEQTGSLRQAAVHLR